LSKDNFFEIDKCELCEKLEKLRKEYNKIKEQKLSLDMSRGKPASEQLDLSNEALNCLSYEDIKNYKEKSGIDVRNYGYPEGLPEARSLMAKMMGCDPEDVIMGGNSSLALMHDVLAHFFLKGIKNCKPWKNCEKIKFLCPVPGYDRHFKMCEYFGIKMIPVKMNDQGPDIFEIKTQAENDSAVKGIWCIPRFSNPSGIVYSADVVRELANLKPAAPDFRILWDNAYCVHDFYSEKISGNTKLLNIFDECKKTGSNELVISFCSTSKITFAGGGIAAIGCKGENFKSMKHYYSFKSIGFDKVNQLRHLVFFTERENKDKLKDLSPKKAFESILGHIKKHSLTLKPKFDLIDEILHKNFGYNKIVKWQKGEGGYFINVQTYGSAKRVVDLCAEAGLILTSAGAAFPLGNDPGDANIRIAPSYPNLDQLRRAVEVFCICAKIAAAERLIKLT
jgi:DNA-binding transcriptional MocR family regulator